MLQIKKWGLYILSSMCLIAILVCIICDYALTKNLTWSLIVLLSLIAGWLVFVPFFRARSKVIRKSLTVISIIIWGFYKMSKENIFSLCPFAAYCNPFSVWNYAYYGIFY